MPITSCPECGYDLVEAVAKEVVDGDVRHRFECSECDHSWSKTLL